mmetsp:Transcript_100098/g.278899  ORF Transcript_100098/g.278899 Transcript_100098/m.278899 type:complete len:201 (-) Transcript_100098:652-1254(-)
MPGFLDVCEAPANRVGGAQGSAVLRRLYIADPPEVITVVVVAALDRACLHRLCSNTGKAHLAVGEISRARRAILTHQPPILLIEGHVWVWSLAGRDPTNVLLRVAAPGVLPPLVGKLEDEAAHTSTLWVGNAAVGHYLLSQHGRCFGLGVLILSVNVGVVGISTVLAQEHWLLRAGLPFVEYAAEADAAVYVQPPNVDFW